MLGTNKTPFFLSLGSIIFGIFFFIFPNSLMNFIFHIFGALIFLFGLINLIIITHDHKNNLEEIKPLIVIDILIMLFGVIFSTIAWLLVNVFIVILGITFIFIGVWGLYVGILDPSLNTLSRILKLVVSVFDIVIGVFLIVHMGVGVNWIMYVIGGLLIFNGICDMISFFRLENEIKTYQMEQKKLEAIDVEAIDHDSLEN